jgi:hypothetical protein
MPRIPAAFAGTCTAGSREGFDLKRFAVFLVLALLAFLPVLPILRAGYGGHDFFLHVPAWLDLSGLWHSGEFFSGWAPGANFHLGQPTFCYYPPVSLAVGAALSFLMPFSMVPAAFVWVTCLLAGICMYVASQDFVAPNDRWQAAALYVISPYLLTTVLVRYAAAEALTLAWLPLLILYFYRAVAATKPRAMFPLGCFLGLTWITNVPASIVLFYTLGAVAFFEAIRRRSARPALAIVVANILGAALAAFYLVPTWIEQSWIAKAKILRYDYRSDFLFVSLLQTPRLFHILLNASALLSVAAIAVCAWLSYRKPASSAKANRETPPSALGIWAAIALVALFFQTGLSNLLWQHLPQLFFAGFPFRFLAPIGVLLPLAALSKDIPRKSRLLAYAVTALLLLLPLKAYRSQVSFAEFRNQMNRVRQIGYGSWSEFTPAAATKLDDPVIVPPVTVIDAASNPTCAASVTSRNYLETVLQTAAAAPCQIQIATYYYPFWRATDDTGASLPTATNATGLLVFTASPGKHTVHVEFHARSIPRSISLAVSIAALILALWILLRAQTPPLSRKDRHPLPIGAVSR